MAKDKFVFTSRAAENTAETFLRRIAAKEPVTAEERLDVIRQILAFSPRDWSADPELWLLYRVAFEGTR